jgi:23S rRNA pseudouridine1911/1915/1917 synthase
MVDSGSQTSEAASTSEVLFDDLADAEGGEETLLTLTVADAGGERLDKWLAAQLPDHSRAEIQRWIEAGLVTRGAKALKASYRLTAGDEITVVVPEPEDYAVEAEPIPLDVVYEDADLLVINKPAGMVVHPAAGNWHGTLVNAILHHCPDLAGVGGARRPGIVHRLDKDTSGLILAAKNDAAHRTLQEQFKARAVRKSYLALVHGWLTPERGEINAPIGRDPRQRQRMAVVPLSKGRMAVTQYEVRGYYHAPGASQTPGASSRFTLVACHPLTGRTHQIRVHLAHARHPIVGDEVYAGRRKSPLACPRQFLHAERIRFRLPVSGQEVDFAVPLPADLQAVLACLHPA